MHHILTVIGEHLETVVNVTNMSAIRVIIKSTLLLSFCLQEEYRVRILNHLVLTGFIDCHCKEVNP